MPVIRDLAAPSRRDFMPDSLRNQQPQFFGDSLFAACRPGLRRFAHRRRSDTAKIQRLALRVRPRSSLAETGPFARLFKGCYPGCAYAWPLPHPLYWRAYACPDYKGSHGGRAMANRTVTINRAPVLTLWAAVVAERLGYDQEAALTLGKAVGGLNAQSKGRRLGIFEEPKDAQEDKEQKARQPGEASMVSL